LPQSSEWRNLLGLEHILNLRDAELSWKLSSPFTPIHGKRKVTNFPLNCQQKETPLPAALSYFAEYKEGILLN